VESAARIALVPVVDCCSEWGNTDFDIHVAALENEAVADSAGSVLNYIRVAGFPDEEEIRFPVLDYLQVANCYS
jgi:hypothetical protein